ncbi:hypothetical protein [Nonomuraea typhae]|uniref:hypothetical protein n=1 Tax=Nonomuraea typhae TaxID=2603600 RepID=UPI0012FC50BF|nr:hypothetical protein [Nonomuraea typhae]
MTTDAWHEIRDHVLGLRPRALTGRLRTLTDAERAEVAERLPGLLKEIRAASRNLAGDLPAWTRGSTGVVTTGGPFTDFAAPLRIAGAATIPGPAGVAAWLARRELNPRRAHPQSPDAITRVITGRPAAWQAELAVRLAGRIRGAEDPGVPLALALLRDTGATPPEHDPLVLAWLAAGVMKDDPLLGHLAPRIFVAQGAGRLLRDEEMTSRPTRWIGALTKLAAGSRSSREMLLNGCVSRFLRGGDATDLRFFVRLHDMLDPEPAESAARARDYLRLLPAAPGAVAEAALTQLRRTGPHDRADAVEAIGALTFCAEAKLARAGLTWLEEEVRQAPPQAGDLVPALVTAFAHTSYDIQRRASDIVLKHAGVLDPGPIADAVPWLPADLGIRVAAAVGGEAAEQEAFVPGTLPAPPRPEPFPAPELVPDPQGWIEYEQWLAAFVQTAWTDRASLPAAVAGLTDAVTAEHLRMYDIWGIPRLWRTAMAKEVTTPGCGVLLPQRRASSPLDDLLRSRYSEIYNALRRDRLPPVLLATPTLTSGHLAPETLAERLGTCAAAGVEPLPADLSQALLRLPRGARPDVAERVSRLGTPAAARTAAWLTGGGPPDPETGVTWAYAEGAAEYSFEEREPEHVSQIVLRPVLRAGPTGDRYIDEAFREPPWHTDGSDTSMSWWPAMLPSHREVVAVSYLPRRLYSYVRPSAIEALGLTDGPAGEASALLLAYQLTVEDSGALPLLRMAAGGDLPAEAVGRQLALLVRRAGFPVRPVLAVLERAAREGAHLEVWRILTGMLPLLLPGPGERPNATHSDAVAFAAEVAAWTGGKADIPQVTAAATGRRSTRYARECARLMKVSARP